MLRSTQRIHEALSFLYHRLGDQKVWPVKMAQLEYLAERKLMSVRGRPLAETQFVNTCFGPMGENVIKVLDNGLMLSPAERIPWVLSKSEVEVLGEIVSTFGELNQASLTAKIAEQCPEWRKPSGERAEALEFATIWRGIGHDDKTTEELEDERLTKLALRESWARSHERTLADMKAEAKNSGEEAAQNGKTELDPAIM